MPGPSALPADLPQRPFRRSDAAALGLPAHVLRGSRFRRVFRDVHVLADASDGPELRYDAARLLLPPTAAASHHLAARLMGAPVPDDGVTHMCVPSPGREYDIAGLRVHRLRPGTPVTQIRGRRMTAATTTFLQLAECLSLVELVVVGDALVRLRMVTPPQLVEAAARSRGRGVRLARRAAALVRPRVDSPMETRLRLLLMLAGLPEPDTNLPVHDRTGR